MAGTRSAGRARAGRPHGLANAGLTTATGIPRNLFHLARCLQDADLTFAGVPAGPQRLLLSCLVTIGSAIGSYAALMDFDIASNASPHGIRR
ncbi:MAG: hypothetical protein U5K74_02680 [Gemmatimonadaceae bacterium]|nr:hypothetical protein [Gemmatimonadaceae bacterium]